MNENKKTLKFLVEEAQNGNNVALHEILLRFSPLKNKLKRKIEHQERADLEQEINEKAIKAILNYDLNRAIELSHFKDTINQFINNLSPKN